MSFGLNHSSMFPGLYLVSHGSVYVGRGYLEAAIRYCADKRLVVLGMEGFTTDGTAIIASMDFIADFSGIEGQWDYRVHESCSQADMVAARWGQLEGCEFVSIDVVAGTHDEEG